MASVQVSFVLSMSHHLLLEPVVASTFFWLVCCHGRTLCPEVGVWEAISAYHRCRLISVKPPTNSEPLSAHQQWPRHYSVPLSPPLSSLSFPDQHFWLYFSTQHVGSAAHLTQSFAVCLPLITISCRFLWLSPRTLRTRRPDWWNYLCC